MARRVWFRATGFALAALASGCGAASGRVLPTASAASFVDEQAWVYVTGKRGVERVSLDGRRHELLFALPHERPLEVTPDGSVWLVTLTPTQAGLEEGGFGIFNVRDGTRQVISSNTCYPDRTPACPRGSVAPKGAVANMQMFTDRRLMAAGAYESRCPGKLKGYTRGLDLVQPDGTERELVHVDGQRDPFVLFDPDRGPASGTVHGIFSPSCRFVVFDHTEPAYGRTFVTEVAGSGRVAFLADGDILFVSP